MVVRVDVKYVQSYDEVVAMVIDGRVDALVADYPYYATKEKA